MEIAPPARGGALKFIDSELDIDLSSFLNPVSFESFAPRLAADPDLEPEPLNAVPVAWHLRRLGSRTDSNEPDREGGDRRDQQRKQNHLHVLFPRMNELPTS